MPVAHLTIPFDQRAGLARRRTPGLFRDALLAFGLLLTPASQLRLSGLPIGPGEACLVVWLGLNLLCEGVQPSPPTRAFWQMITFWAFFILGQSLGTFWTLATGAAYDPQWFMHDVIAYMLLAPVSCFCVLGTDAKQHLHRVAWGFVALSNVSLAIQLVQGWGLISIPSMDPWFWERFRGWS